MEKSKSEALKEKRIAQLLSTIKDTEGRILELQKTAENEVLRLERLRNEESHIQSRISDLERKESDFLTFKAEQARKIEEQKTALLEREKAVEQEASLSKQRLLEASAKLKDSEAKIRGAEAIEARNAESQMIINSKLSQIEVERQKLISWTDSFKAARESVDESNKKEEELLKEKEVALSKLREKQKDIQDKQDHLRNLISENEGKIKSSAVLRAQASDILAQAEQKAKDSQLSVDRQWNEIEIQKKNLKVIQLRMDKIAREKGIEKELKELEG